MIFVLLANNLIEFHCNIAEICQNLYTTWIRYLNDHVHEFKEREQYKNLEMPVRGDGAISVKNFVTQCKSNSGRRQTFLNKLTNKCHNFAVLSQRIPFV